MSAYWADKRVLLTGGSGFLGTHLTNELGLAGCRHLLSVRSKEYDLTHEDEVKRLFSSLAGQPALLRDGTEGSSTPPDFVFHLAGLVGGIEANRTRPADFFFKNIMLGVLTMHYAWKAGVSGFVGIGAGCGYPEHAAVPLKEASFWDGFPQDESAPYSLSKRMLHIQSLAYWRQHRFLSIVVLPGNVYGPNDNFDLDDSHVIPALVRKFVEAADQRAPDVTVWGTGRAIRDFVYAGDVAEAILMAAEQYKEPQLVNIASGIGTSIQEVVEILVNLTQFRGKVRWDTSKPEGQRERYFDVTKARSELRWEARTPLRKGLELTVEWYRANRNAARCGGQSQD